MQAVSSHMSGHLQPCHAENVYQPIHECANNVCHPVDVSPCHAGVLPGLAVALQYVVWLTTQQQQQQQDWRLYKRILHLLTALSSVWEFATRACPAMLRTIIPAVLPLLQQLQRCGQLLPTATVAPPAHSSSSSSSNGSRDTGSDLNPHQEFIHVQHNIGGFLGELVTYVDAQQAATGVDVQMPACELLRDPAVSELLLQQLAGLTELLHKEHVAYRQQQRQQQQESAADSSSSRQLQQRSARGAKQQHRADLLSIPAFHRHMDMLQLLPGGQAYLDAAAAFAAPDQQQNGTNAQLLTKCLHQVHALQASIIASLSHL
jgi:hypothetical protein